MASYKHWLVSQLVTIIDQVHLNISVCVYGKFMVCLGHRQTPHINFPYAHMEC